MSSKHGPPPMVVFSDLDGTLLDHHDYSFAPALPALRALEARGIPLVLTTSKTLAELADLRVALGTAHPAVAENGGHVLVPAGYFEGLATGATGATATATVAAGVDQQIPLGIDYGRVRAALASLRAADARFVFEGFGDLDDAGVAAVTGLSLPAAARARTRMSSEPLRWLGDPADLPDFRAALAAAGLRLNRGGRFFHAQAPVDKADGLRFLLDRYTAAWGGRVPVSVAAGDSDNDLGMLRAAKRAIVIPPADASRAPLQVPGPGTLIAPQPGPAGWSAAVLQLIDEMDTE